MIATSLPKKILSAPEGALSQGVESQWVRVFPSNVQSITSGQISFPTTADASLNNIAFPVVPVRFSIPCGQKGAYVDPARSRLNFRVNYQVNTTFVGTTDVSGFLMGSCLSFWDRLTHLNANGAAIDDETGLAVIELQKQLWSCNNAERDSMAQIFGYGFENGTQSRKIQGHAITSYTAALPAAGNGYYQYSVPLPSSLIGAGAKNMCPLHKIAKLDVELSTAALLPVSFVAAGTASAGAFTVTIDQISIDLHVVYLDDKSIAMLPDAAQSFVHGITYRSSTGTIPSSTQGQTSILMGLRGQSVRSIATRISEQALTTAGSANNVFDAKLPLTSQLDYWLQGKVRVPPAPHNTQLAPATVFNSAMQAAEAFTQKEFRFAGVPTHFNKYCKVATAPTAALGYDQIVVNAGSTTSQTDLACACFAEDLRKVSTSSIMDGLNLSLNANNYLELNLLGGGNSAGWDLRFIAAMDIIYVIGADGNIESRY